MPDSSKKKRSPNVTEHSDALDLKQAGNFLHTAQCGIDWFQPLFDMAMNILQNDNCIIHHQTDRSEDPKEIAHSLKVSAEKSDRRKSSPYRSAMSMLTFYINRAGNNLPEKQKHVLEAAKLELRKEFNRVHA